MHFKIIFQLDGTGIYYDPNEPVHLDSLLVWALAPTQTKNTNIGRSDKPDDIQIPLLRSKINGHLVWHASALFPSKEGIETLRFWRKKFRQNRIDKIIGKPNLQSGVYKEYNMPIPLLLVSRMIAYASGNKKKVKKILKQIKSLGKKRSYGFGKIVNISYKEIEKDQSLIIDDKAMRYLPCPRGTRFVRSTPPYWNNIDRTNCCNVGEKIEWSIY